jgi:hypothetical protein
MGCDVFQLKKDHTDLSKWVIVDDGVPLGLVFRNGDFAESCANILEGTGHIQTGLGTFRRMLVFMKDKKVTDGDGQPSTISVLDTDRKGGFVDHELTQVAEFVNRLISAEIGFDRSKDCPRKEVQMGVCENCAFLRREDVLDDEFVVVDNRWMCQLRRKEVTLAEKMLPGERYGKQR